MLSEFKLAHLFVIKYSNFYRSEEHTSELQSRSDLVCRLLLEKKKQRADHARPAPAAGLSRATALLWSRAGADSSPLSRARRTGLSAGRLCELPMITMRQQGVL